MDNRQIPSDEQMQDDNPAPINPVNFSQLLKEICTPFNITSNSDVFEEVLLKLIGIEQIPLHCLYAPGINAEGEYKVFITYKMKTPLPNIIAAIIRHFPSLDPQDASSNPHINFIEISIDTRACMQDFFPRFKRYLNSHPEMVKRHQVSSCLTLSNLNLHFRKIDLYFIEQLPLFGNLLWKNILDNQQKIEKTCGTISFGLNQVTVFPEALESIIYDYYDRKPFKLEHTPINWGTNNTNIQGDPYFSITLTTSPTSANEVTYYLNSFRQNSARLFSPSEYELHIKQREKDKSMSHNEIYVEDEMQIKNPIANPQPQLDVVFDVLSDIVGKVEDRQVKRKDETVRDYVIEVEKLTLEKTVFIEALGLHRFFKTLRPAQRDKYREKHEGFISHTEIVFNIRSAIEDIIYDKNYQKINVVTNLLASLNHLADKIIENGIEAHDRELSIEVVRVKDYLAQCKKEFAKPSLKFRLFSCLRNFDNWSWHVEAIEYDLKLITDKLGWICAPYHFEL